MANEKFDLSIHVRRMKFMQRGQSPQTNQTLSENTKKVITSEHWELDIPSFKPKESKFLHLDSYKDFIDLRYGRMSYQGFNKTTEKMMKVWNNEEESEEDEKSDSGCSQGSISDEEMAERYTTLVGSIAKKFRKRNSGGRYHNKSIPKVARSCVSKEEEEEIPAKKRKKNRPPGFLKPKDD